MSKTRLLYFAVFLPWSAFAADPTVYLTPSSGFGAPGQTTVVDLRIDNNNVEGRVVAMEWELLYTSKFDGSVTITAGRSATGYTLFCKQMEPGRKQCMMLRIANVAIPNGVLAQIAFKLPENFTGRGTLFHVLPTAVEKNGNELVLPSVTSQIVIPNHVLRGRGR